MEEGWRISNKRDKWHKLNDTNIFEKKKIAFFTPLPPIKSGISDYSVDILNAISDYFDIDVYIDDGYDPNCELNTGINIYNHKKFKKSYNQYYDVIYQIGNSEYHIYMWDYIRKYKGTVVLHDYNMHGVVQFETLYRNNNIKKYKDILLSDYKLEEIESYVEDIKNGRANIKTYEMEINGFITNYANKIIVHSNEAKEKLLKKDIYRNVRMIQSYAKIEPLVDNNEIKSIMNIDNNDIIMASFGHIHETKRAIPILKAFNRLITEYDNVKYYFVGMLDNGIKLQVESFIKENSLQDKVIITGYTELDEFIKYIDLADICFNLRYPYNGETSGSLMRILAKGKCVIVNDIGSFSEVPNECCIKLPSVEQMPAESEIEAIYDVMRKLINKENRTKIANNARKFAEDNLDLNKVSRQYADFINEMIVPSLNETLISEILNNHVKAKNYNDKEIFQLSKTLGFSKTSEK